MSKRRCAVFFAFCFFITSAAVQAKPKRLWDLARFQSCIKTDLGDTLSISQTISSEPCRRGPAVTAKGGAPSSLILLGYFLAARDGSPNPWLTTMVLIGKYERLRGDLGVDSRPGTRVTQIRMQIGNRIFDLKPISQDSRLHDCSSYRAFGLTAGACTYGFAAAFEMNETVVAAARALLSKGAEEKAVFRTFMSQGEEFDSAIAIAELVAVSDASRGADLITNERPDIESQGR